MIYPIFNEQLRNGWRPRRANKQNPLQCTAQWQCAQSVKSQNYFDFNYYIENENGKWYFRCSLFSNVHNDDVQNYNHVHFANMTARKMCAKKWKYSLHRTLTKPSVCARESLVVIFFWRRYVLKNLTPKSFLLRNALWSQMISSVEINQSQSRTLKMTIQFFLASVRQIIEKRFYTCIIDYWSNKLVRGVN